MKLFFIAKLGNIKVFFLTLYYLYLDIFYSKMMALS